MSGARILYDTLGIVFLLLSRQLSRLYLIGTYLPSRTCSPATDKAGVCLKRQSGVESLHYFLCTLKLHSIINGRFPIAYGLSIPACSFLSLWTLKNCVPRFCLPLPVPRMDGVPAFRVPNTQKVRRLDWPTFCVRCAFFAVLKVVHNACRLPTFYSWMSERGGSVHPCSCSYSA